jgi:hypothetical protein
MRTTLRLIGAVAALVTSFLVGKIVLHGYTHHGHLDMFHLVVALLSGLGGLALLRLVVLSSSRPA